MKISNEAFDTPCRQVMFVNMDRGSCVDANTKEESNFLTWCANYSNKFINPADKESFIDFINLYKILQIDLSNYSKQNYFRDKNNVWYCAMFSEHNETEAIFSIMRLIDTEITEVLGDFRDLSYVPEGGINTHDAYLMAITKYTKQPAHSFGVAHIEVAEPEDLEKCVIFISKFYDRKHFYFTFINQIEAIIPNISVEDFQSQMFQLAANIGEYAKIGIIWSDDDDYSIEYLTGKAKEKCC